MIAKRSINKRSRKQARKTTKPNFSQTRQWEKASENGANKPDMMIFDMKNKVITLVEGTVYNIGQINDRNDYKKWKYVDLRLGLRKLYPDYNIKQTNIVFNVLGDFNNTLKKELSDLYHEKDVTKVLTNCQKWIISQNCEITEEKNYSFNQWNTFFKSRNVNWKLSDKTMIVYWCPSHSLKVELEGWSVVITEDSTIQRQSNR